MSLQAYKTAATRAESPREMEYRLFGQVTRALMHASTVDPGDVATRIDALDWNRRLWSTLATDCASPDNAMDKSLRAQIISISLFVSKHSSAIMRGEDDFEALIDINKMVMQGLAGPGPGAAEAA
ncbi:flagellar biosynthesis regulator FlaF [Roseibacterium beibuensis]|uniref:flagellar biosynthesis regulator FlaF n=1 Tax=[Roseibacterium] beibuensis TaxID=1193142 RepID=UPI00217D3264|nr:flagellar biosynthesis regulator FlaF [Roseibacterium beibuensis]MCS6627597.1 flagellar biosynthesis regulator FlaF [Roseibacterium beibuensis]